MRCQRTCSRGASRRHSSSAAASSKRRNRCAHPPRCRSTEEPAKPTGGKSTLTQFLIEALTLSLIGGAIGVVIGAVATAAVAHFAGWQVSMTVASIALAAGFSGFIGIFFGFYPARRASQLLPIQALRYE